MSIEEVTTIFHGLLGTMMSDILGLQSVEIRFAAKKIVFLEIRIRFLGCPNIGKPKFGIEPSGLIKSCLCQNQFTDHFSSLNSTEELGSLLYTMIY